MLYYTDANAYSQHGIDVILGYFTYRVKWLKPLGGGE